MNADSLQRLDLLLLARLATAGPRPYPPSKLEAELRPLVEARLSRAEWSLRCGERLQALQARGDLDERRMPTAAGMKRLCKALGVEELPDKWGSIWQALVPALALELPGEQWSEVASASRLRARLVRQHHGLPLPATPTLREAVDAQAWQQLGTGTTGKLGATKLKLALIQQQLGIPVRTLAEAINAYCWTLLGEPPQVDLPLGKLRRVLLERSLGATLRTPTIDVAKVGERLATDAAGATTSDINAIRRSLVSRWLFGEPTGAGTTASPPPRPLASAAASPPAKPPRDGAAKPVSSAITSLPLDRWAAQVQALANTTDHGRYGDERVFIAAVWRAAQAEPALVDGSLTGFKERLIEANRAGLLRLHRADLVGAMDRDLVRDSEARHLNATFHFIETLPRRTA